MRRIISLLAVMVIMAAMVVASAMPAFASPERIAAEPVPPNGPLKGITIVQSSDSAHQVTGFDAGVAIFLGGDR